MSDAMYSATSEVAPLCEILDEFDHEFEVQIMCGLCWIAGDFDITSLTEENKNELLESYETMCREWTWNINPLIRNSIKLLLKHFGIWEGHKMLETFKKQIIQQHANINLLNMEN